MGGTLFVADKDMLYLVLLVERVINMKCRAAGITKYIFNAFILKTSDNNVSTCQLHVSPLYHGAFPCRESRKKTEAEV